MIMAGYARASIVCNGNRHCAYSLPERDEEEEKEEEEEEEEEEDEEKPPER